MYDIKKTWPKWEIVRTIGEGSFGKVFEICRKEFGVEEHSALKVISIPRSQTEIQALKNDGMTDPDVTEYFKGIVGDFVQEIQLMSHLKGNSYVVAYEDFAVTEKQDAPGYEILIRMELLTGLPTYLRQNRFRVIDVIQLGIHICRALEVCRDLNIVHRDIKPDNIFVSPNGSFKLGDFGVARTIEKTMAGLSIKGTYSYMAPEIYNGKEYGFEADIYSLGIVLYKLLNNNRDPFLPDYPAPVKYSDKTEALVKRIQGLPLPKPDNADAQLAEVIFKACAYRPEDRYRHPADLREALENIASVYRELESEVFSENGINYYTNNSIFGSDSISLSSPKAQPVSANEPPEPTKSTAGEKPKATEKASGKDVSAASGLWGTFCPACGKKRQPGSLFCGYCGHKAPKLPVRTVCQKCGAINNSGVKFCGKCGHKLGFGG